MGDVDTLVRIGDEQGLNSTELRTVLEKGEYREAVDQGIAWAQAIGVTGVPTFIFNEKHGVVGAQEYDVLERVMEQLEIPKRGEG